MLRCQLVTEEGHQTTALMEHDAQARARGIAFHDKVTVEVQEV
jgi:hypothetical protein